MMYADYLKEKDNLEVRETEHGLIIFKIDPVNRNLHVGDLYVKPEFRNSPVLLQMMNQIYDIAKAANCLTVNCIIYLKSKNPEIIMQALLKRTFKLDFADKDIIYLTAKLENWRKQWN